MSKKPAAAIGSAVFFVLAPGTVAGLVPYWLSDGWRDASSNWWLRVPGALLILGGLVVLVHAFMRFVTEGIGTPAPVAPTQHLVVGGLYRFVRNPMYVAVVAIILGQALLFARSSLLVYAAITWAVMALFVRVYEEPALARTFGAEYHEYRAGVRAWLPRLRPWNSLH